MHKLGVFKMSGTDPKGFRDPAQVPQPSVDMGQLF